MEDFYKGLHKSRHKIRITIIIKKKLIKEGSEDLLDIIVNEIKHVLKKIKNNKTPGKDQIVIKAISWGRDRIAFFFNFYLNDKILERWKNTVMILKKVNITNLENYRPINLFLYLYKLFTKIIAKQFKNKLELHQFLTENSI